MCRSRLWLLYWVSTQIRRQPALTRLDRAKSISRYRPPNGTAGLARSAVSGASRLPAPPASTIARTCGSAIRCSRRSRTSAIRCPHHLAPSPRLGSRHEGKSHPNLRLRMTALLPVVHERRFEAVLGRESDERLRPVIEVLAQDVMLGTVGPVEGEVKEAARCHDPPDVPEALVDHFDRGVGEDAVRVHEVERGVRQEVQAQVIDQGQVRQFRAQVVVGDRVLRREQDVGGDVDAVIAARLEVVDEEPPGPEVAAADLQHPHVGLQPVTGGVVELQLADLEPGFMAVPADGRLRAAGCVRAHHRAVVADMIGRLAQQPGVATAAPDIPGDPARMPERVDDLEREPGPVFGVHANSVEPAAAGRRAGQSGGGARCLADWRVANRTARTRATAPPMPSTTVQASASPIATSGSSALPGGSRPVACVQAKTIALRATNEAAAPASAMAALLP